MSSSLLPKADLAAYLELLGYVATQKQDQYEFHTARALTSNPEEVERAKKEVRARRILQSPAGEKGEKEAQEARKT